MYRDPSKDLVGRATDAYGQVERTLRKIIEHVYRSHVEYGRHPDDWWNSDNIPRGRDDQEGTREIVDRQKRNREQITGENLHPIHYATLGNLLSLIRYKDRWFRDRKVLSDSRKGFAFIAMLEEFNTERREKIFHQKLFPPTFLDVKETIRLAKDIIPMIQPKYHDALSIEGHKDLPSYIKASWEKVCQEEEEYLYINFPTIEKTFIGRTTETERIQESILKHRLVTLHGIGGVGKTSTAIHAIKEAATGDLMTAFTDGFVFIPFDNAKADFTSVLQTIIRVCKEFEKNIKDESTLISFLKSKRCLLLLDNWETVHTPEIGAFLYRLLSETRNLHIIATSQRRIDMEGIEKVEPIDPMSTEGELESLDAYWLFFKRVRGTAPDWEPYDTDALRNILKLTAGIPLLIELVAARAHDRTLPIIAQELQEIRFNVLRRREGTIATGPERHASVKACFDWTYKLLPGEVREFFPALSVFPDSFTSAAAAGVSAVENTQPLLDTLHKTRLIQLDIKTGRYSLLSILKEYSLEKSKGLLTTYLEMYVHRIGKFIFRPSEIPITQG